MSSFDITNLQDAVANLKHDNVVLRNEVTHLKRNIEFLKTELEYLKTKNIQHNMFCSDCKKQFTVNDAAENCAYYCPRCCSSIVWVADNQKV